jgi:hypothetical protein
MNWTFFGPVQLERTRLAAISHQRTNHPDQLDCKWPTPIWAILADEELLNTRRTLGTREESR